MAGRVAWAAAAAAMGSGVANAASPISLVNGVGAPITELSARPASGGTWSALAPALSPGARTQVRLADDGCAFDLRATLADGAQASWSGVNVCETRSVTLHRRPDGTAWVDYD